MIIQKNAGRGGRKNFKANRVKHHQRFAITNRQPIPKTKDELMLERILHNVRKELQI